MSNATATGGSDAPFSVDPDSRLKMKVSTLKAIIYAALVITAAGVGYAVNLKWAISSQMERSERIEVRINSLEAHSREQTNAMFDQRMNLKLMDQKLDSLVRNQNSNGK